VKAQLWLGAPAPGRLALPAANPTPSQFYGPRGVFLSESVLIVADPGDHRVLIWKQPPADSRLATDVVLGQPDFYSAGRNRTSVRNGLFLPSSEVNERTVCRPYGICLHQSTLAVADSGNNRVMLWDVSELVNPGNQNSMEEQSTLLCA
jgi:hypothetical protein